MGVVGTSVRRREDPRLVTGRGSYTDDVAIAGALHAVFIRSPHAHARIVNVDTSAAQRSRGVSFVVTGADLPADEHLQPLGLPLPPGHPDRHLAAWHPLAVGTTYYVGEPVAMVTANDPYVAADAASLVEVEYEPLPAVTDVVYALQPDAPLLHPELHTNLAFKYTIGSADTDEALEGADEVVRVSIKQSRVAAITMEPRATLAQYDPYTDGLTVWSASQGPHEHLHHLAELLSIPEHKMRVIARDVGGGFGLKNMLYGDEVAVAWLAWTSKCSVRWVETRSENLLTMAHGRGTYADVQLGVRRDGELVGLRLDILADVGGVMTHGGPIPAMSFTTNSAGPYRIPRVTAHTSGVYTNRAPTAPYRGSGRPEATYALERAMDLAARAIAMDPAELRRRNFIQPDQFPYATPVRATYDSGNYGAAFEKALATVEYEALRAEQAILRENGRYLGVGIASFVELSAPQLWESGTVRVGRGGKVTLLTGSTPQGQGHDTTFAQIVSDVLAVPMNDVEVIHGDTAAVPIGIGTFGSRSTALGGSAALVAASRVKAKMLQIAANLLEVGLEDVEIEDGKFQPAGAPSRGLPFAAVAAAAYSGQGLSPGMSPGLDETEFFSSSKMAYPSGTHVAVVEVDPETGRVSILRYVAVDDCGTVVNPMLVDGQIQGGLAQGLGQALLEKIVYDESGQMASASLLDYAVPNAASMPLIELDRTVTPSPHNPLGAKGVGEAGTVAAPAAISNAVHDALAPFEITNIDLPLAASKIWAAIQAARGT